MAEGVLRIATRRSKLALAQSNWVRAQLSQARPHLTVELVEIVTSGDRIKSELLRDVGGKALFVQEIEQALLDERADIAVHSLKDLPTDLAAGLALVAVPIREDPRDALIPRRPIDSLADLRPGARVGTASMRRTALLLRARPDLDIVPLRGNVDTRLEKLAAGAGKLEAIVLAEAGLRRLGRDDVERLTLNVDRFVPAPGQGALAIEARADRADLAWVAAALDDRDTRLAVEAERAFLDQLGGSCQVPIGAYARWRDRTLYLIGCVADEMGDVVQLSANLDAAQKGEQVARGGRRLADRVRLAGGASILESLDSGGKWRSAPYAYTDPAEVPDLPTPGTVYLVGAGPGDLGLITVRGKRLLESADAVVYDYLANDDLLSPIRPAAERHFVGKRAGENGYTQSEINALLIELAGRHRTVVRLKGGDSFVFGRGGEEAAALVEAGFAFEVVPGVTSAIAAPAYAGVPLTHRALSGSVALVTGHSADAETPGPNWQAVAGLETIVILMGAGRLDAIMVALQAAGRPPDDPVLIVEWASFPRQRNALATLATAQQTMTEQGLTAPTVIVVGAVARLHERLNWFARRPLFGKRILVTRSKSQASRLSTRLFQAGANPVELPALEICQMEGAAQRRLDQALLTLDTYDWVVFTSHNGVNHSFLRLAELQLDARAFASVRLAVIGSATADVLLGHGLMADLVPDRFDADGLIEALTPEVNHQSSVLILRAREAEADLVAGLTSRGAIVDDVAAYFSRMPFQLADRIADALVQLPDLLTFASTKTVQNLAQAAGSHLETLRRVPAACIGPVTRRAAERLGFNVVVQANPFTIDALMAGIAEWAELDHETRADGDVSRGR